jgi:OPT family oligopeptide transporter
MLSEERPRTVPIDDPEARWLAETYQPGVPQLTVRAVLFGMLLGGVMCLSNIYVFFKAGWSMGVTLTAAILAFALFRTMEVMGLVKRPLTALENNALTTVSSGAGYMTGGGNMAAFGALLMITAVRPDAFAMMLWFGTIAALGVFAAIPIKRQLINKEQLVFPTGSATAETIRSIHAAGGAGAAEGALQTRALLLAASFAAVITWFRDAKAAWIPYPNIPGSLPLFGQKLASWTIALKTEVVLIGAGALMSFRTAWSVLLSGFLTYAFLAPALLERGLIGGSSYKQIVTFMVWPSAAILVASGITSFLLDWRSVARTFTGLTRIFGRKNTAVEHPIEAVECPGWWFPAGFIVLTPVVVALMAWLFQIPLWAGLIAVPLALVMGFVAARVTGDTDVTPTKAFGPVTQLVYGVMTPNNVAGNIMSANVTGGVGLHAADLLTTLKTGWLLGGNPRAQFFAQLFGVVCGALLIVPAFNLIIPDVSKLGGEQWPAPACIVWASVSEAFSAGLGALSDTAKYTIVAGVLLGIALALLERFAPKRVKPWVPSPSGLGIAMVLPCSNAIAMFIGGAGAELVRRIWPGVGKRYVVPVASGLIAGESLMGVLVALLGVAGWLKL